jgi:hypothetical protein
MAKGNPNDKKALSRLKKLSSALQKIDFEARVIQNMRHFEGTSLSDHQKLKIYEYLLKTLAQMQKGHFLSRPLPDDCPQEKFKNWRQRAELQKGAWTGFALLMGALVAGTETCENWLLQYGLRLGVYLQMQTEFKLQKEKKIQSGWNQSQEDMARELCDLLRQIRKDLPESSLAFQFLNNFSLQWNHTSEDFAH